ncbi:MAG: molecular chaperone [Geminicoccaceae bacterium]|nr:MAG: molecular chaperone [Geminicoccaceae bacterium]
MRLTTYRTPAPTPFALLDRMLAETAGSGAVATAPFAYDLVHTGDDRYRLELPVVGFAEAELEIEAKGDTLTVRGRPAARSEGETVVHAGIQRQPFERTFSLAEHVQVQAARLERGLLVLDLVREVPEALKPRTIAIGA